MIDEALARKTGTVSEFGYRLDTVADFIFLAVCFGKLLPVLDIENWMFVWLGMIALLKATNIAYGLIVQKKFIAVHSVMNKIAGPLLFTLPLTIKIIELRYSAIVVLVTATLAAIEEGRPTRTAAHTDS